jgi:hypothetical protein
VPPLAHPPADAVYYANLGVIAPDGQVLCSALPLSTPVNLADRAYVREASARRTFAMGE